MTLIIIILLTVNLCIWLGIKRGLRYAAHSQCPCQTGKPVEASQSQPKTVSGVPWAD